MAYQGYLLKIGDWAVPNTYIQPETYQVGVNKERLLKWTNYDNVDDAIYAVNRVASVNFETAKNFNLSDIDVGAIQDALADARVSTSRGTRDAYRLQFYDPNTDSYITDKLFTLEPLKYTVFKVGKSRVFYNPIAFEFSEVK